MKDIRIIDIKSHKSVSGNISNHLVRFRLGISDIEYIGLFSQYARNLKPLKEVISTAIKSNGLNFYR